MEGTKRLALNGKLQPVSEKIASRGEKIASHSETTDISKGSNLVFTLWEISITKMFEPKDPIMSYIPRASWGISVLFSPITGRIQPNNSK